MDLASLGEVALAAHKVSPRRPSRFRDDLERRSVLVAPDAAISVATPPTTVAARPGGTARALHKGARAMAISTDRGAHPHPRRGARRQGRHHRRRPPHHLRRARRPLEPGRQRLGRRRRRARRTTSPSSTRTRPSTSRWCSAAAKLNAVSVAVNWRLAPPEVAYIVNDADAKVFVVGEDFVPLLDAIADELTTVTKIVVIGSPRRLRVLRRLGGAPAGHRSRRGRRLRTTSPSSSTRRARPAGPRA